MSLLLIAQFLIVAGLGLMSLQILRRLRSTAARRAAAFEDFAAGRGLSVYRSGRDEAPVLRMSDERGTVVTLETSVRAGTRRTMVLSATLPSPRPVQGFAALVSGLGGTETGPRLDRAMRGLGVTEKPGESRAVRVFPVLDTLALMVDIPPEETPDLEAMRDVLALPDLKPDPGGTAMLALNPEGLHLRLTHASLSPERLGRILDMLDRLRGQLGRETPRKAA